jgi:hypothetical protein
MTYLLEENDDTEYFFLIFKRNCIFFSIIGVLTDLQDHLIRHFRENDLYETFFTEETQTEKNLNSNINNTLFLNLC